MKTPGGETNQSPEHQMVKLREQTRTGGAGGGSSNFGGTDEAPSLEFEPIGQPAPQPVLDEPEISLELRPDHNDKDMEELLGILNQKGLKAVLAELDKIDNPHIEDDFHRLLVQFKGGGHAIVGAEKDDPLVRALDFVLLEIAVPVAESGAEGSSLADVVTKMEQLYQSVIPFVSVPDPIFLKDWRRRKGIHNEHFSMEIAVSQESEEAVFYIAMPRMRRDIFEKQIFANFPRTRIVEKKDDYNIFNQFGESSIAYGTLFRPALLPIRTAQGFAYDPLNLLLSALSKITKEGEGAAIQISVAGAGEYHIKRFRSVLDEINKLGTAKSGKIFQDHKYLPRYSFMRRLFPSLVKGTKNIFNTSEKKEGEKTVDGQRTEKLIAKMKSILSGVNIRIVTSARTGDRADAMLEELELAFGQYEEADGNRFKFRRPKDKKAKQALLRSFIFRTFDKGPIESFWRAFRFEFSGFKVKSLLVYSTPAMPMNLTELATLFHLTICGGTSSREVKSSNARFAPAPTGMPTEGILLGKNRHANVETDIHFSNEDRMRHFYTVGQTGTGKTNFLKQMIIQDIERGEGVAFIDPHGVDVQDILGRIPPERYDDLIYFDPAHTDRPMGLNMLEYDPRFPEQKTFVVDEMFQIFKKLYGDTPEAFGPIFEQYFRNATLLVLEDPETGSTLMDISRVLSDEDFRHLKLSRSRNPIVNHFWEEVAEQVRGEGDLRNVVPYITSKFDIFIANEIMRPIIGQQRSAFNFQDIMNNKKILLVNLSKGRLGDVNANLLGLIIVGKILMSALSRSDSLHLNPPPFFLYMDEFQNITTNTIATILSEARKYKLSLTMAHQFIKQLQPSISDAVFGNVGSMAIFRVGSDDASFLEKQFVPTFNSKDMLHIDNYNAYIKMLAHGKPLTPFSMETIAFRSGDPAQIEALKQMSYQRYGKERAAIEDEIKEKYKGMRSV